MVRKLIRTLSVQLTPAAQVRVATITVDIGKYYDANAVRVRTVWGWAIYTDASAGAADIFADVVVNFGLTRTMQLPAAQVTTSSGTVIDLGNVSAPGSEGAGEFNILGDAILESPIFDFQMLFFKKGNGSYPALFQFQGYMTIQLEFNVDKLSQEKQFEFGEEVKIL